MKNLVLVFVLFLSVANAQLFDSLNPAGVVNGAAVQSTVTNLAPADASAEPVADTSYVYSGQRLLSKQFVEGLKTSPEAANATAEDFAGLEASINQILDQYDIVVRGIGENPYDLGTAMAAFFEFSYDILHGIDKAPTDAQTLGAIRQWRVAISKTPELLAKSNEEKQLMAESLSGTPLFYLALIENYEQNGQAQEAAQMKAQWLELFKQVTGVDVSELQYLEGGLYVASWMANQATISTPQPLTSPASAQAEPAPNPLATQAPPNPLNPLSQAAADPYVGTFLGQDISLTLAGSSASYNGELVFNGQAYPVQAAATAEGIAGTFAASGTEFAFTASLNASTLTLLSGGNTFSLQKQ
ncbi:MAG: hypothetical protein KC422_26115 [Trueperaceae bacterium]|nr:hypothetical protein [Trueperaceae bacterium]